MLAVAWATEKRESRGRSASGGGLGVSLNSFTKPERSRPFDKLRAGRRMRSDDERQALFHFRTAQLHLQCATTAEN